jgi:hypothetical protein
MKIKNFLFLVALLILGLTISCTKEDTNKVIDKVSEYYVRCDADTGTGVFKFDVNTPLGKFEKNSKSIVITAQTLNNLNLTLTLYTGKDSLSEAIAGNYPLDSILNPSLMTWGLTQTSAMASNPGKKIVIERFEEKENGKRVAVGTFSGNIGSGNLIRLTNGQFKVLINP